METQSPRAQVARVSLRRVEDFDLPIAVRILPEKGVAQQPPSECVQILDCQSLIEYLIDYAPRSVRRHQVNAQIVRKGMVHIELKDDGFDACALRKATHIDRLRHARGVVTGVLPLRYQ